VITIPICDKVIFYVTLFAIGRPQKILWLIELVHEYRDRIYIRKDIILKLSEYGELNQSKLMSYCGLNNVKHKAIIDDMVKKGLIIRFEEPWGDKTIIKYKVSEKGKEIYEGLLEPYEALFPRGEIQQGAADKDDYR
jgi:predicted transcriptional regulator